MNDILRGVWMVFCVLSLRNAVVDLVVGVVELVPVVVDVRFPFGNVLVKKGFVGLCELLWVPGVNPAPVES